MAYAAKTLAASADDRIVAIYVRVSTGYQVDKDSLPFQKKELKAYCKHILHIDMSRVEIFEDAGRSGKNTKRPAYERMMQKVRSGLVSHVLVYKIDRISRNLVDFSLMYDDFKYNRVTFVSLNEQFDTSSAIGEAVLKIILVFAELERKLTSERVKDIMIGRANEGKWNGARVPYGWDWDSSAGWPVHSKKEAPFGRAMYEMYLKVKSTGKIRDYNNAHGIPTKRGGEWTSKTVGDFLRNPMNKGDYRYNYRESARGRKKPADEIVYLEGVFDPLVDPEIWEKVNKIMDINRDQRNMGGSHPIEKNCNVFAGLIQCGSCGSGYLVGKKDKRRKNGFTPSLYYCGAKTRAIHCQNLNVSDVKIGPFVINYISAMVRVSNERRKIKSPEELEEMLLSDKAVFADIMGLSSDSLNTTFELLTGKSATGGALWRADLVNQEGVAADPAEIENLKDQIRKYERAKERLEDAYYFSDDGMSEKEYLEKKNRFDSMRVSAENKLKELTETHIASGVDESAFMKSASTFLLTHKIRAGSHIVYSDLAGMVEEESIKEFFNLVLNHITVKDRRVTEIVFANGLSHKFIYRD
nr:MAG TPA: integrase [Caudoviricetes sp.]